MPRLQSLGTVAVLLLASVASAQPADVAKDPQAILRSATNRIAQAKAFSVDFEFAVKIGLPGLEHGRFARYKIAAQRPSRFLFLRTEGNMGATVACDGDTMLQYASELDQYTQGLAPKSLDEFSSSVTGTMLIEGGMGGFMMALLADDPLERLTSEVTENEYVAEELIDGIACHHLKFVQEEWDIHLWITAGEQATLRRIRPDLSKQLGEEEKEMGFNITISLEYGKWNFEPEITDETFAFTPPASASLVEELTARVPEPVTPRIVVAHPLIGQPAPEFSLAQLKGGEDKFKLAELLGKKVIVLDFWATWCPPCVEGLPQLAQLAKDYKDKPVALYGVNLEEDVDTIREFLTSRELQLSVLLDTQGSAAKQYSVSGIPQTVLIGLDGRVHVVHSGLPADLKGELTQAIDSLLKREDLAAKELDKTKNAGASEQEPASR